MAEKIAEEIGAQGAITFRRFMELALYCPVYGYYEKEGDRIGAGGDYYTSVSVGGLFGELLGFQFAGWLGEGKSEIRNPKAPADPWSEIGEVAGTGKGVVQVVEAGAHDGRLAGDILGWMRRERPELYERLEYWIVEPSERRREWQERALGAFGGKVRWVKKLAELASVGGSEGVRGVIFSNELLDAMPVRRMGWDARRGEWFEWGVTREGGRFEWVRMMGENPKPEIRNPKSEGSPKSEIRSPSHKKSDPNRGIRETRGRPKAARAGSEARAEDWELGIGPELERVLPDGFTVEVSPAAEEWWREAASVLRWGRLMTMDYGWTGEEWLAPERHRGTLRAYKGHMVSGDVLEGVGEKDLTAHVNFGAIQAAGEAMGLETETLESQEKFLTGIAARTWAEGALFGEWTAQRRREFQTLTHPEHLGRAFRVLVQRRRGR